MSIDSAYALHMLKIKNAKMEIIFRKWFMEYLKTWGKHFPQKKKCLSCVIEAYNYKVMDVPCCLSLNL